MKRFTSKTQQIGKIGEDIATRFLVKRGFSIIERNYTKKYGEIDIVATKEGILHFLEVKTLKAAGKQQAYRPEENVSHPKLKRFIRACQVFLEERNVSQETPWQIDVVSVFLDLKHKKAKVTFLENIIL